MEEKTADNKKINGNFKRRALSLCMKVCALTNSLCFVSTVVRVQKTTGLLKSQIKNFGQSTSWLNPASALPYALSATLLGHC